LPYAQSHDRLVIAYSPLAQGLLSGRYTKDHIPQGMRASTPGFLKENLERIEPLLEVLARVGKSHDATSSQVALAWLIKRPNVVVIPGASSVAQLEANAQACDLDLSVEEDQELDEVSLAYRPTKGVAAVPKIAQEKVTRLLNRLSRAREGLGN
jgi:aryl-alcohol dehydrogenase-like predicted oxidoreductase